MDFARITENLPALINGCATTLVLSTLSAALAVALGVAVGLARTSSSVFLEWPSRVFVDVVRGTPLLIQLYLLYYGLPSLGVTLDPFVAAVVALGVNSAAYVAEIVRAAICSIPRAQVESAATLGMSWGRVMTRIVAPQALLIALPALTNEVVDVVKWSSVAAMVVVSEITQVFYTTVGRTFYFVELFAFVSAFYLVVSALITAASRLFERRLSVYRLRG
jgi:His/Glu/Gln/Arg/opine family amino acid ABC transporter permease subunit